MDLLFDILPPFSGHKTPAPDPEDESRVRSRGFPHSLVLKNDASTARDHLANERTFLSWLRLSSTLSIVSLAIIVSFHLRTKPTASEQKMAVPLGILFWVLALLSLANGIINYTHSIRGYASRKSVVETGPLTVVVFSIITATIIAVCILFITNGASPNNSGSAPSHRLRS